jgi:hypothetical protein
VSTLGLVPWVSSVSNVDDFVGWSGAEFSSKYYTAYNSYPTDVSASAFAGQSVSHSNYWDPSLLGGVIIVNACSVFLSFSSRRS